MDACDCGFFDDPEGMVAAAEVVVVAVAGGSQEVTVLRDGPEGTAEVTERAWRFEIEEVVRGTVAGSLVVTGAPGGVRRGERYVLALVKDEREVTGEAYRLVGLPSVARVEDGGRLTWLVTDLYRRDLRARELDAGRSGAAPAFDLRLDELLAFVATKP